MRVFEQKKPDLIDETLSIEEIRTSDTIVKLPSIPRVYQLFIKPYHGVYIYFPLTQKGLEVIQKSSFQSILLLLPLLSVLKEQANEGFQVGDMSQS